MVHTVSSSSSDMFSSLFNATIPLKVSGRYTNYARYKHFVQTCECHAVVIADRNFKYFLSRLSDLHYQKKYADYNNQNKRLPKPQHF